ncbi:MAG TPA: glycosyltransferase 87 family protein [Stellaceae bacterium]
MEAHYAFPQRAARKLAYRLAIPVGLLCLYAAMAGLWLYGAHALYFSALRLLGVEPFGFPFLDTHAVLSAAECGRQGIDVYLSNPCDVLGRLHSYSPLWLAIIPGSLGSAAAAWIGAGLDLLFLSSLAAVLRPRAAKELLIFGAAAVSPMTVYALERANNDLVMFLLVISGGMLLAGSRPYRLFSYVLFVTAGLLKYYPLALLILVTRERRRDKIVAAAVIGSMLICFAVAFYPELGKAFARIPVASSYFTDAFSARNLPFGFAEALGEGLSRTLIAVSLLAALLGVAAARAFRTARLLGSAQLDWNASEMQFLAIGGLLVTACFFAGQNVGYRGILLLPALCGLVSFHRSVEDREVRRFFGQMIAAVLFVMWEECFRRNLQLILCPVPGDGLSSRVEVFFWVGRELIWWWLVVGLAALVWSYLRQPNCTQLSRTGVSPAPSPT